MNSILCTAADGAAVCPAGFCATLAGAVLLPCGLASDCVGVELQPETMASSVSVKGRIRRFMDFSRSSIFQVFVIKSHVILYIDYGYAPVIRRTPAKCPSGHGRNDGTRLPQTR